MTTAAGLPLPSLSRGRFPWSIEVDPGDFLSDTITAYTDEVLLSACGVRILFTERGGGISTGAFTSLDMGVPGMDGDAAYTEAIGWNRLALAHASGARQTDCYLVCPTQVHGDVIVEVLEEGGSAATQAHKLAVEGADAVLVNCSHTAALLRFADCLPLILVAPSGACCVVHCGWKGTIAHLAAKAAVRLCEVAACEPGEMNAYIGAYIHRECFEVEETLAQNFIAEFSPEAANLNSETGKWQVDLGACVRHDLLGCCMDAQRIADIDKCTVCNNDKFFSYRAQNGICGRHAAFAVRL